MTEIGHNNPPEPTPFDVVSDEINDLYLEAKNWCDGEPISTQAQADTVGLLVQSLRSASGKAEAMRKEEVKPLDTAKADIQAKYAPLIASTKAVTGKAVMAQDACKKALAPWLAKVEEERRIEAEKKHREAEEARIAAQAKMDAARETADLEAREEAEAALKDAEKQQKSANRASKEKAHATGGAGRAVGLRDNWIAEIKDLTAATRHYWTTDKADFVAVVQKLADQDARIGNRSIPGIKFKNERKAV